MIFNITTFTLVHVVLSLVGIISGLIVAVGLVAGQRLNGLGVATHNFAGEETTEPSVIGWMPSAQLYFRDPDEHLLELVSPGCWAIY